MSTTPNEHRRKFLATAGATAALAALAGTQDAHGEDVVELNSLMPSPEQMQEFMQLPDGPIVMVNLLKFKADGGRESYLKYGAGVAPLLAKVGAEILFVGRGLSTLIGGAFWDQVALVRYPDKTALIKMGQSPEYQAIHHHREEGLEGQVNLAVAELSMAETD